MLTRRAAEIDAIEGLPSKRKLAVLRDLLATAELYAAPDIDVTSLASATFRRARKLTEDGVVKLYENLIQERISMAVQRAKEVEEFIREREGEERLKLALRAAALATGYRALQSYGADLLEPPTVYDVSALSRSMQGRDDSGAVHEFLSSLEEIRQVYYIFGGVLEIPYDAIVIKVLKEDYGLGVVGVALSERYEDYATVGDVESLGVAEHLDDLIPIRGEKLTPEPSEDAALIESIKEAALVIAKGELYTLYFLNNKPGAPLLLLFTVHCPFLSRVFGVPMRTVNIVLYR
jgi:hypothetical protein